MKESSITKQLGLGAAVLLTAYCTRGIWRRARYIVPTTPGKAYRFHPDLGNQTFSYRRFQHIRPGISGHCSLRPDFTFCFSTLGIPRREDGKQGQIRPQSKIADQRIRLRPPSSHRAAYVPPISSACAATGCRSGRCFCVTAESTALIGPRPLLLTSNQTTAYVRRGGTDLHSPPVQDRLSPVVASPNSQIGGQEPIPANRTARSGAGTSETTSSTPASSSQATRETSETTWADAQNLGKRDR